MNSKGFTLVELLASIAILALILIIAVPSIGKISTAIKENQRKNNIEKIEIAASKYAFDTGETILFVDNLVTEGYLESDDESGNVLDPVNNERMNCYVVETEKQGDYYKAKFIDGKNYDNNGVCDTDKLNAIVEGINVAVTNNGTIINDVADWIKGDGTITLRAYSPTLNIDCEINKCEWTSSSGARKMGVSEIAIENIYTRLETKYTFQMTVFDDETKEIKRYLASIDLKIDNEAPIIYENETENNITNKFINTLTKEVAIEASDSKGSGINGYYLGISNGQSCFSADLEWSLDKKFTISENGVYLICVKDKVGNISSYNGLQIKYIG